MSIFFYLFASHFVCFARIVWWRLILLCQHFLQLSTNLYDLCKWERNETKVTLSTIILFSQWKLVGYKTKGNSLCTVTFIHHNTTNLFMWGKKEREKKPNRLWTMYMYKQKIFANILLVQIHTPVAWLFEGERFLF